MLPELKLEETTTARDVEGWDSLTHVQIIIAIEQAFAIRMTSTEVSRLENAGSLVDVIQHRKARNGGS
jgi:acyl carrier protein